MNALLNRLLLRQKFFILAILGSFAVAVPTTLFLSETGKDVDAANMEAQGVAPVRALLKVVLLTQQHRGLSAIQLNDSPEVKPQRLSKEQEAQQAYATMDAQVKKMDDKEIAAAWQQAKREWETLLVKVTRHSIRSKESNAEHTELLSHLLKLNILVIDYYGLRLEPQLGSYFLIDAILVQSPQLRETLGQMRANGSGMLAAQEATQEDRIVIRSMSDKANELYESIAGSLGKATSSSIAMQNKLAEPAKASRVAGMRALELAQEQIVKPARLTFPALNYYRQFTDTINAQHAWSDMALNELEGMLKTRANRMTEIKHLLIVAIGFLSLLTIFMSVRIVRSVTQPIGTTLDVARALTAGASEKIKAVQAIAEGNLDSPTPITQVPEIDRDAIPKDEVGELLTSIVRMSEVQRTLDSAFAKMTVSLRMNNEAERERDWLKTGLNELNSLMRGEHEIAAMANMVLIYLVERLGAGVGAIYLLDEPSNSLKLTASYALTTSQSLFQHIAIGQGLIGQAALTHKTITLTDVPADYLPIGSALGHATPRIVTALPLVHADNLIGAIELGAFKDLNATELEFLESARIGIAIGFGVNLARLRTQDLLSVTEQQAEELRVQQEELQQTNEELEERAEMLEQQREQIQQQNQRVEASNNEIRKKADELEKVSAYKSEFMANMSHELRTPLNSMLILSKLLAENKEKTLSAKQVEYADTVHSAGKDLLNLINDILDLSKVESGEIEFHFEDAPVSGMCTAMESLFLPLAEQKILAFKTSVASDVPAKLMLDSGRTEQILKNLISNAVKFTPQGEVHLHIHLADSKDNPLPLQAIAFSVSDTGIGIPADKQDLVFDAFKQADGGISRKYGGTGLGLSISRQLARKMDGELKLVSTEGKGSTFTLYLPLDKSFYPVAPEVKKQAATQLPLPQTTDTQTIPPAPLDDDRDRLGQNDKSILIIEDDLNFAKILLRFVREHGFKAIVAADGASGIAIAQHYLPSAILLDVMLPNIDGWGVMHRLQLLPHTRNIPIHFISALDEHKKAMELGAIGYVTKPVSSDQLNKMFDTINISLAMSVRKLLIVEENEQEANHLVGLLSKPDVVITVVPSGTQAYALLTAEKFDCLVLDLGLTEMPCYDLLDQIHQLESAQDMPVIIYSRKELTRDAERELHRYAESIIVKGGKSAERLMNEVALFLHMLDNKTIKEKHTIAAQVPHTTESSLQGKKVLLVDDDMRNIFSLTSLLNEKGIEVIEADNGKEALVRLAANPDVHLVLMDIMMPEMDGYETMRHIRKDPAFHALPIIAMTAKAMVGDQKKCMDAGASDYLAKPIDTHKLLSLLRVWTFRRT
jgi:signal transduction histidine kinase/CheY-like chemotaxis protein